MGIPVGIDLGTTFSAIAYLDAHGRPVTVPNSEGKLITPSVVLYERNGSVVVGDQAKAALAHEPERAIECVKRFMGRPTVVRVIDGKPLRAQDVSAMILLKLKNDFERQIGPVGPAVITVPAFFTDIERCATRDAGRIAGLDVSDIINEPTAAAVAFVLERRLSDARPGGAAGALPEKPELVAVFDLGGGTFDVTIIRMERNVVDVLATSGDVELGGKDWDSALADLLAGRFTEKCQHDPRTDAGDRFALMAAAEEAKRALSMRQDTLVRCHFGGRRETIPVTRAEFEACTAALLSRLELTTDIVIEEAKLTWDRIDRLLLVGGSTRMPAVRDMLRRLTGKEPDVSQAADEVVAHGAAIHAALRLIRSEHRGEEGSQTNRWQSPASTGIEYAESLLPVLSDIRKKDVNSHSLGVLARRPHTRDLFNRILIPRNSRLPIQETRVFGVDQDGQTEVRVRVLEGESESPSANRIIGDCVVAGLPAGLKQGAPVRVTLTYGEDGIIEVNAMEMVSGKTGRARLDRANGMSEEEIQARMHAARSIVIE